ncbi:hypothetical protein WG66_009798, partial [Moniliophthora roreri]
MLGYILLTFQPTQPRVLITSTSLYMKHVAKSCAVVTTMQ